MPEALTAFIAHIERANHLVEKIQEAIDDHLGFLPDDIHWGHVGDAKWLTEKLTEIVAGHREQSGTT